MKILTVFFIFTHNSTKALKKTALCDINELSVPENGEAWDCSKINMGQVKKGGKCTLRCAELFKSEKESKRDYHKCIAGGKWTKPKKVKVKCIYDDQQIDKLQADLFQSESEVLRLESESLIYAERLHHLEKRVQYLDLMKSENEQLNRNINEGLYRIPDIDQVLEINVSTVNQLPTICQNQNEDWTPWRSATNAVGDDYETLLHHRIKYSDTSRPVCDFPSHIEAREVGTNISSINSQSFLVHDSNSTTNLFFNDLNPNPNWSAGISKDFGFICFAHLQLSGICKNYEVRFCCSNDYQSDRQKKRQKSNQNEPVVPENYQNISFEQLRIEFTFMFKCLSIHITHKTMQSNSSISIGDATQIGLECQTGNITDCNESLSMHQSSADTMPYGCENQLIFGRNSGLCGTYCVMNTDGNTITSRSQISYLRSGWTIYSSYDTPDGTGDHENYFVNTKHVYELDGTKYTECTKKAIHIRSRSIHEPWYSLSGKYSDIKFLFSRHTKFYRAARSSNMNFVEYTNTLNPEYGVHCFNNFETNQNCVDMEVSYFVECNKKISKSMNTVNGLSCLIETQTNQTEQNILVLSTKRNQPISTPTSTKYLRTNSPMTISFKGLHRIINFEIDDQTEVFNSCSFTLKGDHWVAGGAGSSKATTQLKKIDNCGLKNHEINLGFAFKRGGCNTFYIDSLEQAWLCFGDVTPKQCYSFDGTNFQLQNETLYEHRQVDDLGSYEGKPFVVGSVHAPYHLKTETYNVTTRNWDEYAEFPFASYYIGHYSMVSTNNAVFILGGKADWGNTSKISRFQNKIWKQVGNLKFGRHGHRALKYGDLIMVVGGWVTADHAFTEVWNDNFTKGIIVQPKLPNGYYVRHELFPVDIGFCET